MGLWEVGCWGAGGCEIGGEEYGDGRKFRSRNDASRVFCVWRWQFVSRGWSRRLRRFSPAVLPNFSFCVWRESGVSTGKLELQSWRREFGMLERRRMKIFQVQNNAQRCRAAGRKLVSD